MKGRLYAMAAEAVVVVFVVVEGTKEAMEAARMVLRAVSPKPLEELCPPPATTLRRPDDVP